MNMKILSVMVAALMVVAGVTVFAVQNMNDADNLNAPITNGSITVNYNDGSGWVTSTVEAYNAAIAVDDYLTNNSIAHTMQMDLYTYVSGYVSINYSYGAITSIADPVDPATGVWNVFIMDDNGDWIVPTDTLGWYKPFGDYDADHVTANVALYYGAASGAQTVMNSYVPAVTSNIIGTQEIQGNEYFKATFYIKVDQSTDVQNALDNALISVDTGSNIITPALVNRGVYVTGYGSDLYLALKDAFGSNYVGGVDAVPCQTSPYTSVYSWLNSFLGLYSVFVNGGQDPNSYYDDVWAWWQEYAEFSVGSTGIVSGNTSDFALGLYSTLDGAPLTTYSFALYFSVGEM